MNNRTNVLKKIHLNFHYNIWGIRQCICMAMYKSGICYDYFYPKSLTFNKKFIKKWRDADGYFNFNGALLPDVSSVPALMFTLKGCFTDTFMIPCCYNDNYSKEIVKYVDEHTREGAYGYVDREIGFDVSVKSGDVVIDAGAWIGDFSAYAASKDALAYAFEPTPSLHIYLEQAAILNNKKIIPVSMGVGAKVGSMFFSDNGGSSFGNVFTEQKSESSIQVPITTIDAFVQENHLSAVDFIKADIEGAERDMLRGARETLKRFAPKIAICTYHLPDDPQVLESLIMEANPNYTVIQMQHKLYACVVKSPI